MMLAIRCLAVSVLLVSPCFGQRINYGPKYVPIPPRSKPEASQPEKLPEEPAAMSKPMKTGGLTPGARAALAAESKRQAAKDARRAEVLNSYWQAQAQYAKAYGPEDAKLQADLARENYRRAADINDSYYRSRNAAAGYYHARMGYDLWRAGTPGL